MTKTDEIIEAVNIHGVYVCTHLHDMIRAIVEPLEKQEREKRYRRVNAEASAERLGKLYRAEQEKTRGLSDVLEWIQGRCEGGFEVPEWYPTIKMKVGQALAAAKEGESHDGD